MSTSKDRGDLYRSGTLHICYHDPDLPLAQSLAEETCKEYGPAVFQRRLDPNQCKITAPNIATFRCYDPKMRFSNGVWVNPLSKDDVKKWRKEQAGLTGQPLDEIYAGPIREIPDFDQDLGREDAEIPSPIESR